MGIADRPFEIGFLDVFEWMEGNRFDGGFAPPSPARFKWVRDEGLGGYEAGRRAFGWI